MPNVRDSPSNFAKIKMQTIEHICFTEGKLKRNNEALYGNMTNSYSLKVFIKLS